MGRIAVLPPDVRSKIAAGEVIVRPNSVIKELLENSLDALARRIEVTIHDGGKALCLVNDDGCGMSPDDARLAVERYATSKIRDAADIERITTFGFRGEALASIAHVSHLELETSDGAMGTHIECQGGRILHVSECARPRGTRIRVSRLFFNLPARLKFLKSREYERRLIQDTVRTYALAASSVEITLGDESRVLLRCPRAADTIERLTAVWGKEAQSVLRLEHRMTKIRVRAYLTPLGHAVGRGANQIFVNGRPVRHPRIARTIFEIYGKPQQAPGYVLFIEVDPAELDVNIHPAKSEVKFRDERYVIDVLSELVRGTLYRSAGTTPAPRAGERPIPSLVGAAELDFIREPALAAAPAHPAALESSAFWQLHNTYICAQTKTGLVIVDQHVAHERIIFENLTSGRRANQRLLFPITLDLSREEYAVFERTRQVLARMGMEFKEFSGRTIVIDSLPSDVKITRDDLAGFFGELGGLGDLMEDTERVAAIVACRSAIKAGQKLSVPEMQDLVDRLFACANPYTCPHGRPIVVKISLEELARRFGR